MTAATSDKNSVAAPVGALVLIADDDPLTRKLLAQCLRQDGYRVATAANGVECLALFRQERPVLVLVDAIMPQMNGFDCCELLLQEAGGCQVPVLVITGLEDKISIDRAFAAGATDYITKPIRWPVLRHRLRLLVEQVRRQASMHARHRELQRLAITDTLTKLVNRRGFDGGLEKEWRRATREHRVLSLMMIDIDSFKPYNDHYGHPQGDRCLKKVAKVIQNNVHRAGDLTARYGGEEFAVVLPCTSPRGALHVAERIRKAVWQLNVVHHYGRQDPSTGELLRDRVTVSIGLTSLLPHPEVSSETLLDLADKALYQAKREGGNKTVCLD